MLQIPKKAILLLGLALSQLFLGDAAENHKCADADVVTLLQPAAHISRVSSKSAMQTDATGLGLMSVLSILGLSVSILAFTIAGCLLPHLPAKVISFAVCAIYVGICVSVDVLIASQKTTHGDHMYAFDPLCAVILTESVKLVVSVVLLLTRKLQSGEPILPSDIQIASDVKCLSLPAALYVMQNILIYVALGKNDLASFGIFRDSTILWTALIWWFVFRGSLGHVRLAGITLLFSGMVLNRAGHFYLDHHAFSWQFLWVLVMTLANASGSVANEFAIKRNAQLDLNLQNSILYSMSIFLLLCLLAVADTPRLAGGPAAFFSGFTTTTTLMVGLEAMTGLLVSRLLKHADAVTKSVASCLRGPLLVALSPAFGSSPTDYGTIVSSMIVMTGAVIYLTQGPLKSTSEDVPSKGLHIKHFKGLVVKK